MYELTVEGMNCGHCVRSIAGAVQEIDSRSRVDADLASKTVRVQSDAALNAVKSAIIAAGYSVTAAVDA